MSGAGLRVGLTGGIACGKSTVAGMWKAGGWELIDADQIARECMEPGTEGHEKTVDEFGKQILNADGSINRAHLGRIVFGDVEKRQRLNAILHPLIRSLWQARHEEHLRKKPETPVLVIIPLLYETGGEGWFDRVVCVGCSPEVQRRRMSGRGWDAGEIRGRLRSQWPLEEKMARAAAVLWNDGSLDCLRKQAGGLGRRWQRVMVSKQH